MERFEAVLNRVSWKDACKVRKGKMRCSRILLTGHRRKIRRFDMLLFGFLFGSRMGTMMARLHMAWMVAVLTELLKKFNGILYHLSRDVRDGTW